MENTTIMNNVETKVKKVSLNGQGVKYMAFGNWLIERQVAGGLMTSESVAEARKLLAMFSSADEQVEFYAKFASECKEHSKSVKAAIRQHNKPPPKAKAVKVVGDEEKKRGRKKKEVVAEALDPLAALTAQLVAAAQSDGPIAPPEFVRGPKEPVVATADEKAAKAAEKELEKAAKAAEKEAEKATKAAANELAKAAKAAEKAAEAEVKKAAKAAEAETKKVAKESDALANAARSKNMTDEKKAEWIAENERIANCARLAEISVKAAEDEVAAFAKAQQDKAAAVETEKVTKAAAVELAKATKAAEKEAEKATKAAEAEAKKAAKAAETEAKKAAKAAEADAKKVAKAAVVPAIPVLERANVVDDEEEEDLECEVFMHEGVEYLIDSDQNIYCRDKLCVIGKYDAETKTIKMDKNESEGVACM